MLHFGVRGFEFLTRTGLGELFRLMDHLIASADGSLSVASGAQCACAGAMLKFGFGGLGVR